MEKYRIITKTTKKDLGTEEETTNERTILQTVKSWGELTREEQEEEIKKNMEGIYQDYQDQLYYIYRDRLEEIKEKYQNINFEDVYIDSNSQGAWIDEVKNFKVYYTININGEEIEVSNINLHIRKYIEEINENDVYIYTYYLSDEELQKIENTKKYKDFISKIVKEVNNCIKEINEAVKEIIENEYYTPSDLDNEADKDFLQNYFDCQEFIFEEVEG